MLTDYDIHRIATEVANMLLGDSRLNALFDKKKEDRLISSAEASCILGISQYSLRKIAPYLGGIKQGEGKQKRWMFNESTLVEKYKKHILSL